MGMRTTKHMETGPSEGWLHHLRVIAVCVLFINSSGMISAQASSAVFAGREIPPSSSSSGPRLSSGVDIPPTALRASAVLAPGRRVARISATANTALSDARSASSSASSLWQPRLRLDHVLANVAKQQEPESRRALPQGDLSRAGIVRATAVQIRGGAFFLVGDYFDHEGSVHVTREALGLD
jgi:hypothetical protein